MNYWNSYRSPLKTFVNSVTATVRGVAEKALQKRHETEEERNLKVRLIYAHQDRTVFYGIHNDYRAYKEKTFLTGTKPYVFKDRFWADLYRRRYEDCRKSLEKSRLDIAMEKQAKENEPKEPRYFIDGLRNLEKRV